MSDEWPFVMREVGDICPDCELLNLPGALCPFHAAAGRAAETLAEIAEQVDALAGTVSTAADELTEISIQLEDLRRGIPMGRRATEKEQ